VLCCLAYAPSTESYNNKNVLHRFPVHSLNLNEKETDVQKQVIVFVFVLLLSYSFTLSAWATADIGSNTSDMVINKL